jgi:anti-sigma B factor antagonist
MKTFELARSESGSTSILTLQGKLTLGEGSRELRQSIEQIAAEGGKHILLDMTGVTYVDSSGLGAMVAGYNSVKTHGGVVGLLNVPKRVQDLLGMSGLTAVFPTFASREEAAQHFQTRV